MDVVCWQAQLFAGGCVAGGDTAVLGNGGNCQQRAVVNTGTRCSLVVVESLVFARQNRIADTGFFASRKLGFHGGVYNAHGDVVGADCLVEFCHIAVGGSNKQTGFTAGNIRQVVCCGFIQHVAACATIDPTTL
ncbi:hypothetical protein CAURIM_13055 (plasmid) [Corynebacterium aurimucosum]|nr:hypothetical protein CAURIM_13055 [Corynebacterium aurimucosum]